MKIAGLQKFTLIDYPGKIAATIFTPSCNMRCPFCHNASLVTHLDDVQLIDEEYILSFLSQRKGMLDGICITGGEPLLQEDIMNFIIKVKELGFKVKLDTNGSFPDKLSQILNKNLLDYVAMDVKNSPQKYGQTIGIENFNIEPILKSIYILKKCNIDYEFRTTVIDEYHTIEDINAICKMIKNAKSYYLQSFEDSGDIISSEKLSPPSRDKMFKMLKRVNEDFDVSKIRN